MDEVFVQVRLRRETQQLVKQLASLLQSTGKAENLGLEPNRATGEISLEAAINFAIGVASKEVLRRKAYAEKAKVAKKGVKA